MRSPIRLYLAPMEGVVDWAMREMYSRLGGIDQFTTEFIRVTDTLLPAKVFYRYMPELLTLSRTQTGVYVIPQILGSDPVAMGENAAALAELGALGVDINFGCPAKLVNRRDGGAVLLKTPERVYKVVESVRKAVPANIPVTAKMRLGFDDPSHCIENAQAIESGGASKVTVHARTKMQAYSPPAHWDWIPKIVEATKIPVVANGDIFSLSDFERCQKVTGCNEFMLGRGAISNPFLFREIKATLSTIASIPTQQKAVAFNKSSLIFPGTETNETSFSYAGDCSQNLELRKMILSFFTTCSDWKSPYFAQARTKQWLRQLSTQRKFASDLFQEVKAITNPRDFQDRISLSLSVDNSQ